MTAEFETEFRMALASASSLERLREVLRRAADKGLERDEARHVLEGMRIQPANESVEDRILEVLDIVSGHCSASLRIDWIR